MANKIFAVSSFSFLALNLSTHDLTVKCASNDVSFCLCNIMEPAAEDLEFAHQKSTNSSIYHESILCEIKWTQIWFK